MDKRFLVVVHAGDESRHPGWLATSAGRDWDLVVCYAGRDPRRFADAQEGVVRVDRAGERWPVLAQLLADTAEAWKAYDYIWLPADDLEIGGDEINRLFGIAAGVGLELAAPSLAAGSAAVHPLALHNDGFALRYASFVDTAAPLFSSRALERALPAMAEPGVTDEALGQRWPALLEQPARACAIVDRVQVRRHAAPQRSAAPAVAPVRLAWGGLDADGRLHHLFDPADDGFVARLRRGYAWMAAREGATLDAIVEEHRAARREVVGGTASAGGGEAFTLTVGTSLAPQGEARQQRAVASWRALGFEVVSFNVAAEIALLQPRYPGVRFVEVTRDGRERTGKPLVRVDDVFAWFRASGLRHGGFVNADIVLQPADREGFLASLRTNVEGAMVFARRVEVDSFDHLEGRFYPTGFDAWFWDREVLSAFEQPTDYYVGFPHWDYYAVLMPLVHGFPVRQFACPVAFHETHPMYYDPVKDGIVYGLKTFELVAPHADAIAEQNHLFKPLLDFFLQRRPATLASAEDVGYYFAFLHALDLWFLDLIDRNSEKIRVADGRPAELDAGLPFLGAGAVPAPTPSPTPVAVPMAAAVAETVTAAALPADPLISVIVPTFNRAEILERCLQHLAAQTLPADRFEVIVVDDGSADHTEAVVRDAARRRPVVYERQPNSGPAAARNRGLARARAPWVLFLNDDALLVPRALEIHLAEHARRGPKAAVLGSFFMHPEFTPTDRPVGYCMDRSDLVFDYYKMEAGQRYLHQHFYTCNLSVAREFVQAHGGFDEGFVRMGAEDIELGVRLQLDGGDVWYRPDCVALHAHRLDTEGLARMYQFRGKGGVHLFVCESRLTPHYEAMPVGRIDELLAIDRRLRPMIERLHRTIERFDALPFAPTGATGVALDERSSGIDLRMMWLWPEDDLRRLVETLNANLERHERNALAEPGSSLEEAAGRVYPALQFIKWWNDTLGVLGSDEIRAYLVQRQAGMRKAA
ncbi:MAG: glycosyltransferase family 2 protein [Rubrivivax sp.]